jgi:hypothetical protein
VSGPSFAPIVHLVREALEGLLAPDVVSVVLLEALAEGPPAGEDPTASDAFVAGPLARALRASLSADTTEDVLDAVRTHLGAVLGRRSPARPSQAPTANVPPERGPVRVVVIAWRDRLVNGLLGALGPDVVAPYFAPDASVAARMIGSLRPPIVLIDGADPLEDDHVRAATEAGDALVLVWASRQPGGQRALERLAPSVSHLVALPHPGGGELLVDYVRARRASDDNAR